MVDMQRVKTVLAKGLTTGAGVYSSTFIGNRIESQFNLGGNGVAAAEILLGAGVALGAPRIAGMAGGRVGGRQNLLSTGVEHFGYGVHGAGFAELADNVQTGQRASRVVTVNARADNARQRSEATEGLRESSGEFSLDTA